MRYVGEDVGFADRIWSVVSYLTAGWGGIIIFVAMYFLKKHPSHFLRFNVYQSIIIAFSLFVIGLAWSIIYNIFSQIPIIQMVVAWINFIFNKPVLLSRSATELFIAGMILYCSIFSLFGRKPIIYKVSELIKI